MLDRLLFALLACAGSSSAAAAAPCYDIAQGPGQFIEIEGYDLAAEAAAPGLMAAPPLGETSQGLLCVRPSVVPLPQDFEALYHAPLYLSADGGAVVLALGHGEGRYLYRIVKGEIDAATSQEIRRAVNAFNAGEAALRAQDE